MPRSRRTSKARSCHAEGGAGEAHVKAICIKKGITLIAMDSPGMWHQVGFLADAFQVFKDHGMSVDLVSTSETNVTVSLDPAANSLDAKLLETFVEDLSRLCRVQVIGPCASVSLVGRNIRGILHQLGDAFELFAEQKVYLLSQAANDLNFTFVVDEEQGERLVEQLHELLIRAVPGDRVLGPTWEQLFGRAGTAGERVEPWWQRKRSDLLALFGDRPSAFVYDSETLRASASILRGLTSVSRVLYAMKANPHRQILRELDAMGLDFECVSAGEVQRVLEVRPDIARERIHFTPNFAPREEYAWAFEQEIRVTVDNHYALEAWPEIFRGREIFVRIDSGVGRGHHHHVRTAGAHSKFGVPVAELDGLVARAGQIGTRIVGLHAHNGSGVFEVSNWSRTALLLAELAARIPDVKVIDVGGGFGVPDRADQPGVDFHRLDAELGSVHAAHPNLEIWAEPGRYAVAASGVLLARVTQLKSKGGVRYVGVMTGMNSLLRPALYGSHHEIVNLSRLAEAPDRLVNVVGPICESADVLGHDRMLPRSTQEGDVLLIANAGAYGHAMSSRYNLREPAEELYF